MSCEAQSGCILYHDLPPNHPAALLDRPPPPTRSRQGRHRPRRQPKADHEYERILSQAKILQAQIEPHFLFNTLAHVSALLRSDPPKAEALLEHLCAFLRSALSRSRAERGTLGEELQLVRDYLEIVGIRLGARLRWSIDAEFALLSHEFPIMLLQPIVENAIRHGIEPKPGGGSIHVRARRRDDKMLLQVCDSGVGLPAQLSPGIGLDNIYRRLQAHYGNTARLCLHDNPGGGTLAELELPA